MLSYETAVKLKEAGFPQTGRSHEWFVDTKLEFNPIQVVLNDVQYCPSLSELIEQVTSSKYPFTLFRNEDGIWYTTNYCKNEEMKQPGLHGIQASSPEEAVANLWLAHLKNKDNGNT